MLTITSAAIAVVDTVLRPLFGSSVMAVSRMHTKCRNAKYPRTDIQRFPVPDDRVSWMTSYSEYEPVKYTADSVLARPRWADADFEIENVSEEIWNKIDEILKIDRRSFDGSYDIIGGLPRNPVGRTGMCGRGLLGRWGPNHAADPIVTRWKRNDSGSIVVNRQTRRPVLQFVSIQRKDSGEWAIPGGMVDPGEVITTTLKREFIEEAMNSLQLKDEEQKSLQQKIDESFKQFSEVYCGYVDDPRNTDNAWMETVAYNFHDDCGDLLGKLELHAGDDAVGVRWMDIDSNLELYASHVEFIHKVVNDLGAHW